MKTTDMVQNAEKSALRRLGAFALVLICGWLAILFYAAHASLPFNPIRFPYEKLIHARAWAPQGWEFYTHNPRGEALLLFVKSGNGGWIRLPFGPNQVHVSNAFGLDRIARAQFADALSLSNRIPRAAFQPCAEAPLVCLERLPVAGSLPADFPSLKLNREVGVVMLPPIPWAWSVSGASVVMPSRVTRIEVGGR